MIIDYIDVIVRTFFFAFTLEKSETIYHPNKESQTYESKTTIYSTQRLSKHAPDLIQNGKSLKKAIIIIKKL